MGNKADTVVMNKQLRKIGENVPIPGQKYLAEGT